jgi:hypothetical protein
LACEQVAAREGKSLTAGNLSEMLHRDIIQERKTVREPVWET